MREIEYGSIMRKQEWFFSLGFLWFIYSINIYKMSSTRSHLTKVDVYQMKLIQISGSSEAHPVSSFQRKKLPKTCLSHYKKLWKSKASENMNEEALIKSALLLNNLASI